MRHTDRSIAVSMCSAPLQVLFPLEQLNLSQYVLNQQEQPPIYDCYAVSNHYGGLGGGHYTAFAQMPNDKKWYCFDDSRVDDIAPDGVSCICEWDPTPQVVGHYKVLSDVGVDFCQCV